MQNGKNKSAVAGREVKSDARVTLLPNKTLEIEINSSVGALFGKHLGKFVHNTATALGLEQVLIKIDDYGALDYVLLARLEAAADNLDRVQQDSPILPGKIGLDKSRFYRLRRSRLYIPGNSPEYMTNAGLYGADSIILDLEDSVIPDCKHQARRLVHNALRYIDFNGERIVRINPLNGDDGRTDLEHIVPAKPDTILIPKCECGKDVVAVEAEINTICKRHTIKRPIYLMPLIETAKGVLNAGEIALASKKNVALCFGAEDFTASIGVERTKAGRESLFAQSMIVLAAKAAGIQALDTVYSDVDDSEGLLQSTRDSIALGFDGRGIIHPSQIKIVHQAFTPSKDQLEWARRVEQAIDKAKKDGKGVATLGGKMIDAPVVSRAQKIITLAKMMEL